MNFELRRIMLIALGVVPECTLGAAVLMFGGEWKDAGIVLAVLVGIYLLVWFRNAAWGYVQYLLVGRKLSAELVEANLIRLKYPMPHELHSSEGYLAEEYFEETSTDSSQPIETRLHAAKMLGVIAYLEELGDIQMGMRVKGTLKEALKRYRDRMLQSATKGAASSMG